MFKTGKYVGTGASLDIPVPFESIEAVKIVSVDTYAICQHNKGDTDGTMVLTDVAVTVGTITIVATACITLGDGKFTVGTNADINTLGNTYIYEVYE